MNVSAFAPFPCSHILPDFILPESSPETMRGKRDMTNYSNQFLTNTALSCRTRDIFSKIPPPPLMEKMMKL